MTETPSAFFHGDPQLGRVLKKLRETRAIPTQRIADALDIKTSDIYNFESGHRPISVAQLSDWIDTLGISPNLFFSLYKLGEH
jgi:transcriptional regulator with XRE-family HTH domain